MMTFQVLKALHIIFMVSWFAGLFYIVRLFIYHTEAQERPAHEKQILSDQFTVMEKKLWWIITTPAMVLTLAFGVWMLIEAPFYLKQGWMHIKLGFVVLLVLYHLISQRLMFQIQRGVFSWSSTGLRIWNEGATLVLVAVVFIVVMQNTLNWISATVAFFAVAIALLFGIKLYKKLRNKKNKKKE